MQIVAAGDRALLVELGSITAAELHAASERAKRLSSVVRSTPGHSSLYVVFKTNPDVVQLRAALETPGNQQPATSNKIHQIPVHFAGENLDEFLAHAGLSRPDFLSRVHGLELVARYLGFRGGFAYLDGWPQEWAMPRRATSRPVLRGSFAIAGNVAAFYPIDTPGGWNVLGHTDVDLENAIASGDVLRISVALSVGRPPVRRAVAASAVPHAEIVSGPLALWTSSPFDTEAAVMANDAVGNDPAAPVLECPLAAPRLRFTRDAVVAWVSPLLDVRVERVRAGEERAYGRVADGLRAYLAVGDREGVVSKTDRGDRLVIRAMPGPHDLHLGDIQCEVLPQLDRVGIRLRPLQPLSISAPGDLPSIGMQCGTVQLHPDGTLVAMGPDHPATGGYLQPFTVLSTERWKLAQLTPGDRVRFEMTLPASSRSNEGTHHRDTEDTEGDGESQKQ